MAHTLGGLLLHPLRTFIAPNLAHLLSRSYFSVRNRLSFSFFLMVGSFLFGRLPTDTGKGPEPVPVGRLRPLAKVAYPNFVDRFKSLLVEGFRRCSGDSVDV